ncbi:MAG: hypothetical protein WBM17_10075 [Anaerolineales bacterium]
MPRTEKSTRVAAILAVAAALYGSSLACCGSQGCSGAPSQAPTATPTAPATLTSTPTPTVTPSPTEAITADLSYPDWPVVLSDSFDDNRNQWFEGEYENDSVKGNISIENGKYRIDLTAEEAFTWWVTQDFPPADVIRLEDFFISVEARKMEGPGDLEFGIMFRYWNTDQYVFTINADHQDYSFRVYAEGQWTTLIDRAECAAIVPDGSNRIAVLGKGSVFSFFINGECVHQAEDDTLKAGTAGMGLMGWTAGIRTTLEFDNFEARAPESDG